MVGMDLGNWRQRIDEIDLELTKLLNERMSCALQIGAIKRMAGRPIRDPEREQALIKKLKEFNHGPMRDETIEEIFRRIIAEAVHLEEEGLVVFNRVVIVGVGLIGGSLGLAIKRSGFKGVLLVSVVLKPFGWLWIRV